MSTKEPRRAELGATGADLDLRSDLAGMSIMTVWALGLLPCGLILWWYRLMPMHLPMVAGLAVALLANSVLRRVWASRAARIRLLHRTSAILAVLIVTAIIHYIGGAGCLVAGVLYVLVILGAGGEASASYMIAFTAATAYAAVLVAEHPSIGLLTQYWEADVPRVVLPESAQITLVVGVAGALVLTAAYRNRATVLLNERNKALRAANAELHRYHTELEMLVQARTLALETSTRELDRAYTELKATHAQLLQAEKLASLGQLVAGIAHEINTPATAILGNMEPLGRELRTVEERAGAHGDAALERAATRLRSIFQLLERGVERTAAVVQDLRTFARVAETQPTPTDLHESFEVSLRLLRPRWVGRIRIERQLGDLPRIDAIAAQVNQLTMNLLANACDAIEQDGMIRIRTWRDGEHVRLSVTDDGCGIPPELLPKLFDPFFTTKPVGQGMGLGLAICAGIARGHGGTIEVSSGTRGSTFTVCLPIRWQATNPAAARTLAACPV